MGVRRPPLPPRPLPETGGATVTGDRRLRGATDEQKARALGALEDFNQSTLDSAEFRPRPRRDRFAALPLEVLVLDVDEEGR